MPAYPEFTQDEFERRWERARAAMAADGFDALLITSESNYRYLSGHVTQVWANKFRPTFMLLPPAGDPVLVCVASEAGVAALTSFVRDLRTFVTFVEPGIAELAGALGDRGLSAGTIGCEFGTGQRLGMPLGDLQALERRVPPARFLDAGPLFWSSPRRATSCWRRTWS